MLFFHGNRVDDHTLNRWYCTYWSCIRPVL